MKLNDRIGMSFLLMFLSFGGSQQAFSEGFYEDIKVADQKVILEQYEEAKVIYQQIISSSDFSIVEAYAHYKLGSLYSRQQEPAKAISEYQKGLQSLKEAGETNHQIGKYLVRAINAEG